jgi:hypothetical protein
MASSVLNSDDGVISGTAGLKSVGGDDGNLVFQSKGTETARINTDKQIVAAAGTASLPIYSTTGDLNTGIYFPSADTIGFAEGGAQCGEFDSSANFKFNSGYGSVATAYGCRAWVNFDGSTAGTNPAPMNIRASGNVSSVTRNDTGVFTVNFATAMPDTNYAWSGSMKNVTNNDGGVSEDRDVSRSTTSISIITRDYSTNSRNPIEVGVIVFR